MSEPFFIELGDYRGTIVKADTLMDALMWANGLFGQRQVIRVRPASDEDLEKVKSRHNISKTQVEELDGEE